MASLTNRSRLSVPTVVVILAGAYVAATSFTRWPASRPPAVVSATKGAGADQLALSRLVPQGPVELFHRLRTHPAGDLEQGGGMGHRIPQTHPAEPPPGDGVRHLLTEGTASRSPDATCA